MFVNVRDSILNLTRIKSFAFKQILSKIDLLCGGLSEAFSSINGTEYCSRSNRAEDFKAK